jgi:hypothetical protein
MEDDDVDDFYRKASGYSQQDFTVRFEEYLEENGFDYEMMGNSFKVLDGLGEGEHMVVLAATDGVSASKRTEPEDRFAAEVDPLDIEGPDEVFEYLEGDRTVD